MLQAISVGSSGSAGALYAMSDNVFDIRYSTTGEVTYSETNHRATFINSSAAACVARLLTGYGELGQDRVIEFECMVLGGGSCAIGLRSASLQTGATTGLVPGTTGDITYRSSTGAVNVAGSTVDTVDTWTAGDKVGFRYQRTLGIVNVYKSGSVVATITGVSGDYMPAAQGLNNNTNSMRVSTAWSYTLPGAALYWR